MSDGEICIELENCLKERNIAGAISLLRGVVISFDLQHSILSGAIFHRSNEILRLALDRTREMLAMPHTIWPNSHSRGMHALWFACSEGNLDAAKILVDEYGQDILAPCDGSDRPETVIKYAVSSSNVELVQWLLDRGAVVNETYNNCHACYHLLTPASKGNLPLVKLLVERGGLINGINAYGLTPLDYAKMGGSQEVIDYLRSVGAKHGWELRGEPEPLPQLPAATLSPEHERLNYHFQITLGCRLNPFAKELLRPDWPITVHLLQAEDCWILATEGMSSRSMIIPESTVLPTEHDYLADEYQYAELFIRLPLEWPVNEEWMNYDGNRWILDWIFQIARWPDENRTWLGLSAIFANDDPPEPLVVGTPFTCLLVTPTEEEFSRYYITENRLARYYWIYPIYTEERDFERRYGTKALLKRFAERGCPLWVDPKRPNVALDS